MDKGVDCCNPVMLGKALRLIRKQRGLTQEQVADVMGISRPSLVVTEQGKRYVRWSELTAFCQLCDTSIEDVFAGIGQEPPPEPAYLSLKEENRALRRLLQEAQEAIQTLKQAMAHADLDTLDEKIHQLFARRTHSTQERERNGNNNTAI